MGGQIDYIKEQLRRWRGLERLVEQEVFEDFYCDLNEEQQTHVIELLISGDLDALKKWMSAHRSQSLEGMQAVEVRRIAATLDIKYYNTLSKRQLIYKIRRIRRDEYSRNTERKVTEVRVRLEAQGDVQS